MADPEDPRGAEALARALPRAVAAGGHAERLARDWVERAELAEAAGGLRAPCYPFSKPIADALFEARRARWMIRGLEGATEALEREQRGLEQAAATRPGAGQGGRRISRLLVVSNDGSPRFDRAVDRLRRRHAERLELIRVEASAGELGGAVYGAGRSARALLIDHKAGVVRLLEALVSGIEPAGDA